MSLFQAIKNGGMQLPFLQGGEKGAYTRLRFRGKGVPFPALFGQENFRISDIFFGHACIWYIREGAK